MNILVTGGAGFIGSHIADAYISLGHSVTVIDDLSTGRRENVNPAAQFHQMDIRDTTAVLELFRHSGFDLVNHHAAQMDIRRSVSDPTFDASVNILGSVNLLEACVRHGVRKFIFASSGGAIYGEQKAFPADENHARNPISPYGVAKLAGENYLHYYGSVHGVRSVSFRYGNVYGPRQNPHGEAGVIAIFASRMLSGEHPIINGDGKQTRDYVFVADVVDANTRALSFETTGAFNVGTSKETSVNELYAHLKRITRSGAEETHGPAKPGEQLRSVLSWEKIRKAMGWAPRLGIEEGLKRTVEFFRKGKDQPHAH